MDLKNVKALVKILNKNNLSAIEVCDGNKKIKIEKNHCDYIPIEQPSKERNQNTDKGFDNIILESGVDFNNITEVKSPMVGVFYTSPSPESPPFVKVGDKIKKGDVLCIVEAMKLMNEICAETEGEIIDVCVENEQVVEYGQILFKVY